VSEIHTGWRSILARPEVYRWAREVLGLNRWLDKYVMEYVKPQPGEKILDIGCGTGEIVRYLAGCEYLGIDRHQPYITYAQQTFGSAGRFICADVADHIDAFDSRFDVILANGLLHHLDDDLAHRLFELGHRALAENGRLITVDPCYFVDQSRITRFIVSRDRGQNVRWREQYVELARPTFQNVAGKLWHGYLPIPFSVSIVECRKMPA
jgi:SAM-dependent methyltransferase